MSGYIQTMMSVYLTSTLLEFNAWSCADCFFPSINKTSSNYLGLSIQAPDLWQPGEVWIGLEMGPIWQHKSCRIPFKLYSIRQSRLGSKSFTMYGWNVHGIWKWSSEIMKYASNVFLTYWGWDKVVAILQMAFSNVFSLMKMYEFSVRFHLNLFLRVK